jgi:F-box protein 20
MVSQQQKQTSNQRPTQQSPIKQVKQQLPTPKQQPHQQTGYNQNHWLLQEAELRRQLASIPTQSSIPSTVAATQRPTTSASHKTSVVPQKGMLSVSGKKKCSSCGDELGRGCAAMVVESLSLYYHINCFRCSVCNIQLGLDLSLI